MYETILINILSLNESVGWLIATLAACLTIFFAVNGHLNKKLSNKADKNSLDVEIKSIHEKINKKADTDKVNMMYDSLKKTEHQTDKRLDHLLKNKSLL